MPSTNGILGSARSGGKLYGWGKGAFQGATGDGTDQLRSSPVNVSISNYDWEIVSRGRFSSIGLRAGRLYTWGTDASETLGNGASGNVLSPTQIGSDTDWSYVAAGNEHMLAIKRNGELYCWGKNANGQTGLNTTTGNTNVPTKVGTDSDWLVVGAGQDVSYGIKTNGTLWSWGNNSNFSTGLNTNTGNTIVPTQVGSATDWKYVEGGQLWAFATKTGNSVFTWGVNAGGRTGAGTTSGSRTIPTQIGTATDWTFVSCGLLHGLACRNGQLWGWGRNSEGQLGDTTTTQRNSPIQSGSATDWRMVAGAWLTSGGLKTNGTLYTWGEAADGKLGNGTTSPNISSPAQIGSDSDWQVLSTSNGQADGFHGIRILTS
jgi:alpha-tubulin suppressor-like RCC1 family protein